jgi:hypothetical protein
MDWKNKEEVRVYMKEYYLKKKLEDPLFSKRRNRRYRDNNTERLALDSIKARAKLKGIIFDLKWEDIKDYDTCPVFNEKLKRARGSGGKKFSPSVDRIDPTKGYTKDNIQVISKLANSMKSNATPEELLKFADWVYKTYNRELVK